MTVRSLTLRPKRSKRDSRPPPALLPCPECGGDGRVTTGVRAAYWGSGAYECYPEPLEETCEHCEGEGSVEDR